MNEFFNEFKEYINDFEYNLILVSHRRIVLINTTLNKYIEFKDDFMMIDILEYLISTKNNLTDILKCDMIRFSTDAYIKQYVKDYQQYV